MKNNYCIIICIFFDETADRALLCSVGITGSANFANDLAHDIPPIRIVWTYHSPIHYSTFRQIKQLQKGCFFCYFPL